MLAAVLQSYDALMQHISNSFAAKPLSYISCQDGRAAAARYCIHFPLQRPAAYRKVLRQLWGELYKHTRISGATGMQEDAATRFTETIFKLLCTCELLCTCARTHPHPDASARTRLCDYAQESFPGLMAYLGQMTGRPRAAVFRERHGSSCKLNGLGPAGRAAGEPGRQRGGCSSPTRTSMGPRWSKQSRGVAAWHAAGATPRGGGPSVARRHRRGVCSPRGM